MGSSIRMPYSLIHAEHNPSMAEEAPDVQVHAETLTCLPLSSLYDDTSTLDISDRIILPASWLAQLQEEDDTTDDEDAERPPMTFCLEFQGQQAICGEPGGQLMLSRSHGVPKAEFLRLRCTTTSMRFIGPEEQKELLEQAMRGRTCLTVGDHLFIRTLDGEAELVVEAATPGDTVCVIDTDCSVDLVHPPVVVPPAALEKKRPAEAAENDTPGFVPFVGKARKLVD